MARTQFTVRCTPEQSIRWQSRMGGLSCKTVEQFIARCTDLVCKRLDFYYRRAEREMARRGEG